ncbi:LAMI_0C00518g1_1 [Lachancea mirantina]|uniref:Peroxisomal ATPase PEX6 n=1 Tax=Lachancea mirantina TaxID=1230905 RepID=A0A1G4J081_9SACH|nr:LAMI_0C00518g1_1 [Lachancea mirantina]
MTVISSRETVHAKVEFHFKNPFECSLSSDLFSQFSSASIAEDELINGQGSLYVNVKLVGYDRFPQAKIFQCHCDYNMGLETVKLPGSLFGIQDGLPTVDRCEIWALDGPLKSLTCMVLAIRPSLFKKLSQLSDWGQKLDFLKLKCNLNESRVYHEGDILWTSFCRISDCLPDTQGFIGFASTKIVLHSDESFCSDRSHLDEKNLSNLHLLSPNNMSIQLRGLNHPVPERMLRPTPGKLDDDSMFVFAQYQTLLYLGVTSGSHVLIKANGITRVVKVFLLLEPNDFEKAALFAGPRLIASIGPVSEVSLENWTESLQQIPLATSVSVARVLSWNNCQKAFETVILNNLTQFLTKKNRILHSGDVIPITFDSNQAPFFTELQLSRELEGLNDSLAWFSIEKVRTEDSQIYDGPFMIDSKHTTLVTEKLKPMQPLKSSYSDFLSYHGLERPFIFDESAFPYAKKFTDIIAVGARQVIKAASPGTAILLHSSTPSVGKTTLVRSSCYAQGLELFEVDCVSLSSRSNNANNMNNVLGYLKAKIEPLTLFKSQSIVYLSHIDSILEGEHGHQGAEYQVRKLFALEFVKFVEELTQHGSGLTVVFSANDVDSLPDSVRAIFRFEIFVPVPDERQRKHIFEWYLSKERLNLNIFNKFEFEVKGGSTKQQLALKSAGLTPLDIKSVVLTARASAARRKMDSKHSIFMNEKKIINEEDLLGAIEISRDEFSDAIGAPKIPSVQWADIGGMDIVKGEIMDTIELPLKHPELFSSGMKKRSGILFYGPPGTGKTLLAKAIATNFSLNFFSVKGPELLNMYIGESEANVRRVFEKARDAKPCVIFFDELDSVAPKRGNQGDSGGVMDRIVSQLLAELDGMSSGGDGVFVIGATNRPDLLDEALLRPGRFDKLLYLGISDTNEKQANILQALTRKMILSPTVDFIEISKNCPFSYTGADFYALCSDAMLKSMLRKSKEADDKLQKYNFTAEKKLTLSQWFDKVATTQDLTVEVNMEDFSVAQRELIPSVSQEELDHYLRVKHAFERDN